jgi:hypothetical protein
MQAITNSSIRLVDQSIAQQCLASGTDRGLDGSQVHEMVKYRCYVKVVYVNRWLQLHQANIPKIIVLREEVIMISGPY